MWKLEFHPNWIQLTIHCISSVSYYVLVNGSPQDSFKPSRGLRQGDILFPYLFIICSKALTSMIQHAEQTAYISSFPVERSPLKVSHLLVVDDCIIFCKANSIE